MRIAFYNQMFGMDGRNIFSNLFAHWIVHYQSDVRKVRKHTRLNNTIEIVNRSKADIIGIGEVLDGQEDELIEKLQKIGYKYFFIGKGHSTKYTKLHVNELIASRIRGKQIDIGMWPMKNCLGGGGGLACSKFDEFHLILAHLGLPSKKFYKQQMEFLEKMVSETKGKLVLMGDFNQTYDKIKDYLGDMKLASDKMKTCSTTRLLRWFYNKDVDHILHREFKKEKCGSFVGVSDHKLIYADFL